MAFASALACWILVFILVFKCVKAIEHQGMKDDLSLGDAHPRAPRPLLRNTRLQVLSLFCTWYCVRGRRAGAALATAVAEQQEGELVCEILLSPACDTSKFQLISKVSS